MEKESSIDEICELVVKLREGCPPLLIEAEHEDGLRKLAIAISKKLSVNESIPIYIVQGHIRGEQGWPFSRIRKGTRLRLESDSTIVTETGGVIFPQDRPIILLVEYFDCLEPMDQRAYCHLVDGEGKDYALHPRSILIGGLLTSNRGRLEPGSADRGMKFKLVSE
jgi:hypothetical protein